MRQEALIALRFVLGKGGAAAGKVVDALVEAAEVDDRTLAQTALITLGGIELPARAATRVARLAAHPDIERARFVIEQLGRQRTDETARLLVEVLVGADDRRRAELAAQALEGRTDAATHLANALIEAKEPDRARVLRHVLRPMASELSPAARKRVRDAACARLERGEPGFEPLIDVARDADPKKTAEALRTLAAKLRKGRKSDRERTVLRLIARGDQATDDDRYRLASLTLAASRKDTRGAARAGDPSLGLLAGLIKRGFDVASALRKDRSIGLEELYYVGFHFVEEGHPLGEELLAEVVDEGGRKKIARMAKNKLDLAGL